MDRKKLSILTVMLFLTLAIQIPAFAQDWPMFRANSQRTGNVDNNTAKVDFTGRKDWTVKIPDAVRSSPAIFKSSIIFGSNNGNVYSMDLYSGKINWSFPTGNWVVSSPAVVDGKVFVGSYDSKMYCLDASTGKMIWKFTTHNSIHSSPAVADGVVYFGSNDGYVYAVNIKTGWQKWK